MLQEITPIPAASLPLTEFGAQLRLGSSYAEDDLQSATLEGFLRAAFAAIEGRIQKALMTRAFRLAVTQWSTAQGQGLSIGPVQKIDAVALVDMNGAETSVPMTQVWLDPDAGQLRPIGAALPTIPKAGRAVIVFQAGFGPNWSDVPADLRQAVLVLAAHFYEYRDDAGLSQGCMPFGVTALLERYRPMRLGALGARS